MKKIKKPSRAKRENYDFKRIIFNFLFAVIAILIIFLFQGNLFFAAILEIILGFIGLFVWRSKITTTVFIMGGLWGTLIQLAVMSSSQGWQYVSNNDLMLFPFWMIIIWANASSFIYETTKEIKKLK